jgi:signal transduction histidine kinase
LGLAVWDNGPGIPPGIQDSVFQPFVSYGKSEGSGLGLAIAKKIVQDHGGEIYLDGGNETGTLFRITIPFAIPEGIVSVAPIHSRRNSRSMTVGVNTP